MSNIILVTSEKGGQGKSVICKCLADYAKQHGHPVTIFDADDSNPDVKRTFGDAVKFALFNEARQYQNFANAIIEDAEHGDVLVNCPASVFQAMKHWFEKNDILDIAEEMQARFIIAFVSDGEPESLQILKNTLSYFQGKVRYVVLRNLGTARVRNDGTVWGAFKADTELQSLLAQYNAEDLEFPEMHGDEEMQRIKEENLSFWESSQGAASFKRIQAKRVYKFITEAFDVIAQADFFSTSTESDD